MLIRMEVVVIFFFIGFIDIYIICSGKVGKDLFLFEKRCLINVLLFRCFFLLSVYFIIIFFFLLK